MRDTILIISEYSDVSTNKVMEYLHHHGEKKVIRINAEDVINLNGIDLGTDKSSVSISYLNREIVYDEMKSIWYRRGDLLCGKFNAYGTEAIESQVNRFLLEEWRVVRDFLLGVKRIDSSVFVLGDLSKEEYCNKLHNLNIAHTVGIKIPPTIITSRKSELEKFINLYGIIVTKAISNTPTFHFENSNYSTRGTAILTAEGINKLPDRFFPILAQKYIDKVLEVRVFYIKGDCYAMAIFSQDSEKTKIDYRNYDHEQANRIVPFKLPTIVKQRILKLMRALDLDTGSLDLIYTTHNEFVFLEVNPCGQFDWLSYNCNYYIERRIAKMLSNGKN
ncbi:grasp-with-spasm system ATP-grasp peptide maturase [Chitinophaga eiseniae]|uniref:Grasp-with-spasm system ATP-grasp peptide maturase n=1 Tax=Chitinophaga eiseniae TaxID=634771 RepID=A0A847SS81_9BACT|nr:grasp-with-spasm system ATP-grasp peptide maturase [Chitinophaga eiseniae]NLR82475.1 grasp-with-spasm system ATP-grasp peptide maturase [Chitinophaga eiseniae]